MIAQMSVFLVALAILAIASRFVISSSIRISEYFRISEMAVGYLMIAVATSVPDIFVSATASHEGIGSMALGDIFGSSIANICLVLGIAAILRTIRVKREQSLESAELLLLITIIPLVLVTRTSIGSTEGGILIVIFLLYVLFAIKEKFTLGLKEGVDRREWTKQVVVFLFSISVTLISAQFIVHSGAEMAAIMGVSPALVGLTVIAFGTTLPELAIDFTAIRRGHFALAIGDIFGSCVTNLTLALGLSAMMNPLANSTIIIETALAFLVGVVTFVWYILMKHEGIRREYGVMLLLAYIVFVMLEMSWGLAGH